MMTAAAIYLVLCLVVFALILWMIHVETRDTSRTVDEILATCGLVRLQGESDLDALKRHGKFWTERVR